MSIENVNLNVCNVDAHSGVRRKIFRLRVKFCNSPAEHIRSFGMRDNRVRRIVEHQPLNIKVIMIKTDKLIKEGDVVAVRVG